MTIPNSVHEALISRIKILAELILPKIGNPQDGRVICLERRGRYKDFNNTHYFGEKAVLRLLNRHFFTKKC